MMTGGAEGDGRIAKAGLRLLGEFGSASKVASLCGWPNETGPDVKLGSTRQGR